MSSLSNLDKEIQNYKRLITDIAELFLKYLIFKRDNKQLSQEIINSLRSDYVNFKFMRFKLLYGTAEILLENNNNVQLSDKEQEQKLTELEKQVFGEKIDMGSQDRINRTSRKLKILSPNIGIA